MMIPESHESPLSHPLAAVVFGDEIAGERAPKEAAIVERFRRWLEGATRASFHAGCREIDDRVVASLTGPNLLAVARMIEARFPEAIENMPRLAEHLRCLDRAKQLEQVFMPNNLRLLAEALFEEGDR